MVLLPETSPDTLMQQTTVLLSETSPRSQDSFEDPEVAKAAAETCSSVEAIVGSRHLGLAVRAAAALLGVVAVAGVGAAALSRTHKTSEVTDSLQLSGTVAAMPRVSAELNDYFDSEVIGKPVNSLDVNGKVDDKNACLENEELHAGLCYKKCALLTNGTHPFRSTAWTCCKQNPCGFEMPKHDAGLCSGYDVSGDGRSCPHQPGTCLNDEELWLGVCYKKCAIITNGEKPYRFTPFTCCKTKGVACFNPTNSDSSLTTDTGGGYGNELAKAHMPIRLLSEAH